VLFINLPIVLEVQIMCGNSSKRIISGAKIIAGFAPSGLPESGFYKSAGFSGFSLLLQCAVETP